MTPGGAAEKARSPRFPVHPSRRLFSATARAPGGSAPNLSPARRRVKAWPTISPMQVIRRNDHAARIEMLPLIDVIFLLLTFFIYSMVLMVP